MNENLRTISAPIAVDRRVEPDKADISAIRTRTECIVKTDGLRAFMVSGDVTVTIKCGPTGTDERHFDFIDIGGQRHGLWASQVLFIDLKH